MLLGKQADSYGVIEMFSTSGAPYGPITNTIWYIIYQGSDTRTISTPDLVVF